MTSATALVAVSGLAAILLASTAVWLLSLRLRDASIADPFWGPGFALVGFVYVFVDGRFGARGLLTLFLVSAWAARLGRHLWTRNRTRGEDPRYGAMRARHGARFGWVSLFTVFWLQAVLLWLVAAPLLGAVRSAAPLGVWDAVGMLVFLVGFTLEALADRQLARFRASPAGDATVLDTGLWRYSRHPNYFGNFVIWWGLYLIAVGGGAYWTVFGPALITFLLLRVSGVTLLEKKLRQERPGYAAYMSRTSAFVPWPPKR